MNDPKTYNNEWGENSSKNTLNSWEHKKFSNDPMYMKLVHLAGRYYDQMHDLHERWQRANDFAMGRQLEDMVEYNGMYMTTEKYIQMKGLPALQNDIITNKLKTLIGLVREQNTTTIFESIDERGAQVVGMFNEMLRQNNNLNFRQQNDAEMFREFLIFAFLCYKTVWKYHEGREDIWNERPDIYKLALPAFSSSDLHEIEFIAEAHDLTWGSLLDTFAETTEDIQKLTSIYTPQKTDLNEYWYQGAYETGMNQTRKMPDFYHPTDPGKYRVLEIWTKERMQMLWCHDYLTGDAGFRNMNQRAELEEENERRRQMNIMRDADGMPILDADGQLQYYEDPNLYTYPTRQQIKQWREISSGEVSKHTKLIIIEERFHSYWYYRFVTPNGYLLREGVSPYKVNRNGRKIPYHPYTFLAYPCVQGEVRSYVMELEHSQRAVNHYMILMDFVIQNEAKGGTLAIDKESLTPEQSIEDIRENYISVDGVILYSSKKGGEVPQAIAAKSVPAGIQWMIEYKKSLDIEQSGVQGALQGVHHNTSGKQYQMERQQSAVSVSDYTETFNQFKLREGQKKLWTMQCFYDSTRSIQITGEDYRRYYDEEYSDIDLIAATDLDEHSAAIRDQINDMLWQLMIQNRIGLLTMFKGGNFRGTERAQRLIEQEIQEQQQAMAQQQNPAASSGSGAMPMQQGVRTTSQLATHLKDENGNYSDKY